MEPFQPSSKHHLRASADCDYTAALTLLLLSRYPISFPHSQISTIRVSDEATRAEMKGLPKPIFPFRNMNPGIHKNQPRVHIPRPRNAFILFRCNLIQQEIIPAHVVKDHPNISRIAGKVWNGLTVEQQQPWVDMAVQEKQQHLRMYPGYRFIVSRKPLKKIATHRPLSQGHNPMRGTRRDALRPHFPLQAAVDKELKDR